MTMPVLTDAIRCRGISHHNVEYMYPKYIWDLSFGGQRNGPVYAVHIKLTLVFTDHMSPFGAVRSVITMDHKI